MKILHNTLKTCAAAMLLGTTALPVWAQEVILDRQVRAGALTLFPSVNNPTDYYYAPTRARLATNDDGLPEFSFTRYIEPTQAAEASEQGNATGIVHAVVELGVTEEDLEEARDVISDLVSGARVLGPVTFTSGTFALVSSFAEEGSETTSRVVGVGKMPLLEGDQAAVSLRLTRQGTLELWENFARATPDISFSFEAEVEGFRSPKRALIEADFSRVYSHRSFDVGVATPIMQAEIEGAFDDLVREGAIRITQIGEDDAMNEIIETAYERLIDIIFEKAETTGVDAVNALSASATGADESMLDKASALLASQRTQAQADNTGIRSRNGERGEAQAAAAVDQRRVATLTQQRDRDTASAAELRQRATAAREAATQAEADAVRFDGEDDEEAAAAARVVAQNAATQATNLNQLADAKDAEVAAANTELGTAEEASAASNAASEAAGPRETESSGSPVAIVAAFRMKEVRETGSYRIDLNKYTADTMELRFDENIGDMSRFRSDERVFATVDLADTAARQREVAVFIDGLSAEDFGTYINFATILLRKDRDGADPAIDDVRVDRENFSQSANDFRLVYNKLTDGSSEGFLDYEYAVDWNFFGGATVDGDWQASNSSGIGILPPFQKRTVFLEADPEIIEEEGVRSIEVQIFYEVAGVEQSARLSLRPRNGEDMSAQIDFMLPRNEFTYDYVISWRLRNGDRPTTGRLTTTDGTLFIDELPEV